MEKEMCAQCGKCRTYTHRVIFRVTGTEELNRLNTFNYEI